MTRPTRNTTRRDRHRRTIARDRPPCGICGGDIDYTLPWLNPGEYVVDHIVPVQKGGLDELENKQAAHRRPGPATVLSPTVSRTNTRQSGS